MDDKQRTIRQNSSLHLYFTQLAEAFNDAGYDIKKTLSQDIAHPWTGVLIKELLWRVAQDSYLGKKSTTRLNKDEVSKVYDIVNRFVGEKFGIHIPFPYINLLMEEENNNK